MSKSVKYYVMGTTLNFLEFDLTYPGVTLDSSDVLYNGGSGIETVLLGRNLNFDFTKASGGTDRLYLKGSSSDYTFTIQGSNVLLTDKTTQTTIKLAGGSSLSSDNVFFTDGSVKAFPLFAAISNGTSLPTLDNKQYTPIVKNDLYASLSSGTLTSNTIKAFAASNDGVTFATTPKSGMLMVVNGGSGIDVVYVSPYSNIDATKLSGGTDQVYFSGNFSEYATTYTGSNLTLVRSNGQLTETVKVAGGSSLAYDKLIFADGFVKTYNLFQAIANNTTTLPIPDPSLKTPGLAPTLQSNPLDDLTNLDVTSNIVINFTEAVTPQSGKYIRIVNDLNQTSKNGFYGENTANTLVLDATSSFISVVGSRVTINPNVDFDFSNNYHIEIDTGAFKSATTGAIFSGIIDSSTLNFSTVTPSNDKDIASVLGQSKIMQSDGTLADSYIWKDTESWPNGKTGSLATVDLSNKKIALVMADFDSTIATIDPNAENTASHITTSNFYLALQNFGVDDLLYMDDLGRNAGNYELEKEVLFALQSSTDDKDTSFYFDPDLSNAKDGGIIDIIGESFKSEQNWMSLLSSSKSPFVFGSTVDAKINHNPISVTDVLSAVQDRTVTYTANQLLANDSDIDGDILVIKSVSDPVGGNVVLSADGSITFTPNTNFIGPASFNYTVTDGTADSLKTPVTVNVIDTLSPIFQSLSIQPGRAQLVLTYDTPLDSQHPPLPGAFAVNGQQGTVAGVVVNGNTVTLTLINPIANGPLTLVYTDPSNSNDAAAIQDLAGNDASTKTTVLGVVADGYVRGAQMYLETMSNTGAILSKTALKDSAGNYILTNAEGNFFIPESQLPAAGIKYALVAEGGTNIDTGLPNTVSFKAPAGSTTVNPLTTLVQTYIQSNPSASVSDANNKVATALGLDSNLSLTTYDPLSSSDSHALIVQKAAASIATVLTLAGTTGADQVLNNMVTQVAQGIANNLVLTNSVVLGNVLVNTSINQNVVFAATTAIANATSIDAVSTAQSNALTTAGNHPPVAVADAVTAIEDTPVTYTSPQLLANDSDVDTNTTLSIKAVSDPVGGSVKLNPNGSVTFTPSENFNGQASFNYIATDGISDSVKATVTINVTAVNDAPVNITSSNASIKENAISGALVTTLTAIDVDVGDTFIYSLAVGNGINDADNGLVQIVGDQIKVKNLAIIDFETNPTLSLNISVTDKMGATYTKSLIIDVTNDPSDDAIPLTQLDQQINVGTQEMYASFDASNKAVSFSDNITQSDYFKITGFGSDDTIAFSGLIDSNLKGYFSKPEEIVSFGVNGHNVELSVNNNGVVSQIILTDVIADPDNTFVYDLASFNALPIGDLTLVGIQLP